MRPNSGLGKAKNNNHDPTLRDHEGSEGPAQQSARLQEGGAPFDIAGNVKQRGQDPSPDDRARGERSDKEAADPFDL